MKPTTPAGDARRDELKANADALAEEAEKATADIGAIDPAKMELDNEIAIQIVSHNALEVTKAQRGFRYCWVRAFSRDGKADMQPVFEKQTVRVRLRGGDLIAAWEVVTDPKDPEARECIDVHGYRRIGDVILLRCREDVWQALDANERLQAAEFAGKYEATIDDAIGRAGLTGIATRHNTGGLSGRDYARMRHEFARQGATAEFDKMLRSGTVPNLPPAVAVAAR